MDLKAVGQRIKAARELLQMYTDDSFHSTKFSQTGDMRRALI